LQDAHYSKLNQKQIKIFLLFIVFIKWGLASM
jgi:hypothetical protein